MRKILPFIAILCFFCLPVMAEEVEAAEAVEAVEAAPVKAFQNHLVPVLGFSLLQTAEKDFVLSPSVNLQYIRVKTPGVESHQPDAVVISGGYSQNYFTAGLGPDSVKRLHNISLMGNLSFGKNSFVGMLSSGGEVPFSSINTVSGALMYMRQLVDNEHIAFSLGGGIMVGDFGIKIKDFNIYVLPLPVFNFSYTNDYFYGSIGMTGMPGINITLFPKAMFRLNGMLSTAGFKSARDIIFDCSLAYYPLLKTSAKDFLSFSAGVSNSVTSYKLKDKKSYGYQFYSVYGQINASLVNLKAGYNFDGKKLTDGEAVGDMYKGLFASVQAMYMF